jgi:hypothetical protein
VISERHDLTKGQRGDPKLILSRNERGRGLQPPLPAWRRSKSVQLGDVRQRCVGLFELNHGRLDVLTHRTFKGPNVVPRLLRLNARQIHLCRACWARWSDDNRTVFRPVLGKSHLMLPCFAGGSTRNSQPPTPGPRSLSVMCLVTLCSPRGTVQNGSLSPVCG